MSIRAYATLAIVAIGIVALALVVVSLQRIGASNPLTPLTHTLTVK